MERRSSSRQEGARRALLGRAAAVLVVCSSAVMALPGTAPAVIAHQGSVAVPPPQPAIGGGAGFTCTLDEQGALSCWGSNAEGELGDDTMQPSLTERPVWGRSDGLLLATGGSHACAVSSIDGHNYNFCWGADNVGQLGDGPIVHAPPMVPIIGPHGSRPGFVFIGGPSPDVVALAAGDTHTCAVQGSGAVWCWGGNARGQLGDGTATNGVSPVQVTGAVDAVAVDGGGAHTCAVDRAGSVWCWGANEHGQLGDGTTTDRLTPTVVPGIGDAVAVAAGEAHTCALRSDGTVSCWGRNDDGRLGDGTTTARSAPVTVSGLGSVSAIAAGAGHSCALTAGNVRCWGANSAGQLGDGTNASATTPVPVAGVTDVRSIGLGSSHSCAVRTDRSVWCWGANASGQLGDGSTTARTGAVRALGLPPVPFGVLAHTRVLDTRPAAVTFDGLGAAGGVRPDGAVTVVPVAGRAGVPAGAAAVVLNVTATEATGDAFITAYPCDVSRPWASNLNVTAGQTVANAVTVGLGGGGDVCLANQGAAVHLVADVTGYHPDGGDAVASAPARLFDSRPGAVTVDGLGTPGAARNARTMTAIAVAGRAGVPADAESVTVNVTAVDSAGAGFVTLWPCGAPFPPTSNLNPAAGRTVSNAVTVRVGDGGRVCAWVDGAATHLVIDLLGHHPAGARFQAVDPARLADTRSTEALRDGTAHWVMTTNRFGIPTDAAAIVLNVTVTDATGSGYLTVWPCEQPRPWASSVNFARGRSVANQVTVSVGQFGWVCAYGRGASANVIYDVTGYHPSSGAFRP